MEIVVTLLLILLVSYALLATFFYVFQESFLFQAKRMNHHEEFRFDFPFEERNHTMSDGGTINSLFLRTPNAKGAILFFHGNAGDLTRWGKIAQDFTAYGYDILVFDYRGYGKSTGHRSMHRMNEDGHELYKSLLKEYDEKDIVIYGRSIGCAMATWLAARVQARMLLLETPFYAIKEVFAFRLLLLPARLVLRFPFSNARYFPRVQSPIHIIHGTMDGVVPYYSGKKLYSAFKDQQKITFTTISGGGHNDLISFEAFSVWLEEKLA